MIDFPSTARPTDDGIVSRNTMPSDFDSVLRNSSMSPAAALREIEGSVAEPIATPNNPERKLHEAERVAQPSYRPVEAALRIGNGRGEDWC